MFCKLPDPTPFISTHQERRTSRGGKPFKKLARYASPAGAAVDDGLLDLVYSRNFETVFFDSRRSNGCCGKLINGSRISGGDGFPSSAMLDEWQTILNFEI